MMERDTLILLKPDFLDPAYPGTRFFCWHCALLEGVLHSFPTLGERVEVRRIDWPRPRREVIELLGHEHQSLPVLILARDSDEAPGARTANGFTFIDDKDAILAALAAPHGVPVPHP